MSSSTPHSHTLIQAHRGQVGMSSPSPTAWRCIYSQGGPFLRCTKTLNRPPGTCPHQSVSQSWLNLLPKIVLCILASPFPLPLPHAALFLTWEAAGFFTSGLTLIIQPSHQNHGMKSTIMPLPLLKPLTLKAKPIEAGQTKAHTKAPTFPAASAPTLPPTCSC